MVLAVLDSNIYLKLLFFCPMKDFHSVKVCGSCNHSSNGGHCGILTRACVMAYFKFFKSEANKILHNVSQGGFYNQMTYIYQLEPVVKACKRKYGCSAQYDCQGCGVSAPSKNQQKIDNDQN
jgi:hypothetical protein